MWDFFFPSNKSKQKPQNTRQRSGALSSSLGEILVRFQSKLYWNSEDCWWPWISLLCIIFFMWLEESVCVHVLSALVYLYSHKPPGGLRFKSGCCGSPSSPPQVSRVWVQQTSALYSNCFFLHLEVLRPTTIKLKQNRSNSFLYMLQLLYL